MTWRDLLLIFIGWLIAWAWTAIEKRLEVSVTFERGRTNWRFVALGLWGPWCRTRRCAIKNWIRVKLGFQPYEKP